MKACPYCAEMIQDSARKCRFCGEMLPGHAAPERPQRRSGPACPKCGSHDLRNGPWHYLWFEGDGEELYDLSTDPREQRDLSRTRAPLAGRFRAAIHSWRRRIR